MGILLLLPSIPPFILILVLILLLILHLHRRPHHNQENSVCYLDLLIKMRRYARNPVEVQDDDKDEEEGYRAEAKELHAAFAPRF